MLGGSRFSAPYRRTCDSVAQSLLELELELELLVDAGVLAGAAGAGVDELLESPLDDVVAVELDDDELSDDPTFDDELEPPRLSVL